MPTFSQYLYQALDLHVIKLQILTANENYTLVLNFFLDSAKNESI